MTDTLRRRYDQWLYPTAPVPTSRPDHLAVLARLCGLQPAPVHSARVLELGCGDGANLIPRASQHPEGRFVGLDLSPRQVARGRADIDALGLPNIELHAGDFADAELGTFDYVLAVGVLSWVSPDAQDALFAAVARHLDEGGIATLSFNCWPGWQPHDALRNELLAHVAGETEPSAMLAAGREHLAAHPPFAGAAARLDAGGDAYLLHEYLAPHNHGFWLDQVVAMAARHGLQFLGTASVADLAHPGHEQQRAQAQGRASDAVVLAKQDRGSVLAADVVHGLFATAQLERYGDAFHSLAGEIRSPHAPTMAALDRLAAAFPAAQPVAELTADDETVLDDLTVLAFAGVVELHTVSIPVTNAVSARPTASPLARLQASRQPWATDVWHRKLLLRPDQAQLLARLDGTATALALSGELGRDVMPTLHTFARNGLLIA